MATPLSIANIVTFWNITEKTSIFSQAQKKTALQTAPQTKGNKKGDTINASPYI